MKIVVFSVKVSVMMEDAVFAEDAHRDVADALMRRLKKGPIAVTDNGKVISISRTEAAVSEAS